MCHSDQTDCRTRVSPNQKEAISSKGSTVSVLTSIYAKILKAVKIEGAPEVPMWPKYGAIPTIIPGVTALNKNGTRGIRIYTITFNVKNPPALIEALLNWREVFLAQK